MIRGTGGMDTVFGALVLILVCFISSSIIVSMPTGSHDHSPDIASLESRFDCVLYSTIELDYCFGGHAFSKTVTICAYSIEMSQPDGRNPAIGTINDVSEEVRNIVDFYFSGQVAWFLGISVPGSEKTTVSSRGSVEQQGVDVIMLDRKMMGLDGGAMSLTLTLVG